MDLLGATIVVILFALLLNVVGVIPKSRDVVSISRRALQTIGNKALSDADKERLMQEATLQMLRLLVALLAGTAVALLLPLAIIWALQPLGLFTISGVLEAFTRWDFIVGGSILGIATYFLAVRWSKRNS